MSIESLEQELKELIIETLELEDISADDIESSEPLFIDGLSLDSIDALELGVALQLRYLIVFDYKVEDNKKHFATVKSLAKFVDSQRKDNK
jgi:acyl carrier protein|tara:strand:- start:1781 stop:2053 length:273 start_codon:yes stop_codon:yes gene_type:complete